MRQAGFTLLELLIAMTLLGLLVVMLYSGMNTGIRSWDTGIEHTERVNALRLAQEFIRTQLRQSLTVFRNDSQDGRVVYFEGERDSLGWVAPLMTYLGRGGLYFVKLDQVKSQDGPVLRLRWHPYLPGDGTEAGIDIDEDEMEETILLLGAEDFTLRYFGPAEPGDEPDWHEQWDNPQERPRLVQVRLTLPALQWPELTVALTN